MYGKTSFFITFQGFDGVRSTQPTMLYTIFLKLTPMVDARNSPKNKPSGATSVMRDFHAKMVGLKGRSEPRFM